MLEIHKTLEALRFGGVMVYPLLLLAVLAVVVMLDKAFVYWRYVRLPGPMLELVETYDFSWSDLEQQLTGINRGNYFKRFFREVMDNRGKPVWWVE